jgi:tape measure domain-containing protein
LPARATTFTTYVNVEERPGASAVYDRLERRAVAAFSTIERAADQAARAQASISNVRGGGTDRYSQQLRTLSRDSDAASRGIGRLGREAQGSTRGLTAQANATEMVTRKTGAMSRAIDVASRSLNIAQGPLGPLAGRLNAVGGAIENLTGLSLGIAGGAAALIQFGQASQVFTDTKNKLQPLFEKQEQVNKAFDKTVGIANRTRQALAPVVDLYAKLSLAGPNIGGPARVERITELAAKAARASGGSTISQAAGLTQFGQGVGSEKLAGDELKSVKENTLFLAKAIADGFKNADGSIGTTITSLTKLASEGEVTGAEVADALERSALRIETAYSRVAPTVGASLQTLSNNFLTTVGKVDEATGGSALLAKAITTIAENLREVVALGVPFAAVFAANRFGGFAQQVGSQLSSVINTRREVERLDNEWVRQREAAVQSTAAAVRGLESERAAIRRNIVELERKRQAEAASRASFESVATGGTAAQQRLFRPQLQASLRAETAATLALADAQGRLTETNRNLRGAVAQAEVAQTRLGVATENVSKRVGLFRGAASSLVGFLGGPWGIAFAVATTAVYLLATAQSSAEIATRKHEDAQRVFAGLLDRSTGKIYEQVTALQVLAAKKQVADSLNANASAFGEQRQGLARTLAGFAVGADRNRRDQVRRVSPQEQAGKAELAELGKRVQNASITYEELSNRLVDLGKKFPAFATTGLPRLSKQIDELRATGTNTRKDSAALRIGTKNQRSGDLELFLGTQSARPPGGAEDDKKKKSGGVGGAKASREAAAAAREEKQSLQELAEARLQAAQTDLEDRRPLISTQQYIDARLKLLETYDAEVNAIDSTKKASNKAGDQRLRDARAVAAARFEIVSSFERESAVSALIINGRFAEANATRRTLELRDRIGDAALGEYNRILEQERAQERINDILASRERLTGAIVNVLDTARDGFEDFLVDLPGRGGNAFKQLFGSVQQSLQRVFARRITESLFAGADEKIRNLISGTSSVDQAATRFAETVGKTDAAGKTLAQSLTDTAAKIVAAGDAVAAAISGRASGPAGSGPVAASAQQAADTILSVAGGAVAGIAGLAKRLVGGAPDLLRDPDEIVVTARTPSSSSQRPVSRSSKPAGIGETIFSTIGDKIDGLLGTRSKGGINGQSEGSVDQSTGVKPGFFGKLGSTFGKAFEGAGQGAIASGFVKAIGIKQSQTGAQIGGAIGAFIPGVGPILGGLIGGTIGGLFKKPKTGTATIGNVGGEADITGTGGNSGSLKREATGIAKSVNGSIETIVEQLNADLGGFSVSVGKRNKKFVVDPTGKGRTKGSGVLKFDDVEDAQTAAIRDALIDGAAKGISAASQTIIRNGKDLQKSIEKAVLIESIPRRLLQRTDPVRFAVEELNDEFKKIKAALDAGSASAAQYADATKLYEIDRAEAIEQATARASDAIDQFLKDMIGSSSSPLNKRDTFANASRDLDAFRADVGAGKRVDDQKLLAAARNFQDASRDLNGSSQAFFRDFEDLRSLLAKARDNAGITNVATLPASPFAGDSRVEAAISTLQGNSVAATINQTAVLGGKLDELIKIYREDRFGGGYTIGLLPGFSKAA